MPKLTEFFKKYDDILKPTVVLLLICLIIPLALSVTNMITKDRIDDITEQNNEKARKELIEADEFKEEKTEDFTYFKAIKEDETVGFVFTTSAKGYGGDVSVMTVILPDGKIKSVKILDVSNETPGLGQNAAKESFYSQFEGKESGVAVVKNGAKDNQVNAVTGATVTSKAVNSAIDKAFKNFETIKNAEKEAVKSGK